MTTIANDTVVDVGLSALVFGSALCYLGAAYLVLVLIGGVLGVKGWPLGTAFAVFFCSYFFVTIIAATTVEVLRSSYKAVFVCFVQVRELLLLLLFWCVVVVVVVVFVVGEVDDELADTGRTQPGGER